MAGGSARHRAGIDADAAFSLPPGRQIQVRDIGAVLIAAVALLLVDLVATSIGYDPLYRNETEGVSAYLRTDALYDGVAVLVSLLAMAPAMATGLAHLGLRERRFHADDFFLLVVVQALGWLLFLAAIALSNMGARLAVDLTLSHGWPYWIALAALLLALAFAPTFLPVRLWLLAPLSLRDGRVRILASWRMTRGRFWRTLAYAVVLLVVTTAPVWLTGLAVQYLPPPPPLSDRKDGLDPLALGQLAILAVTYSATNAYAGAAHAFAFGKLVPPDGMEKN